MIHKFVAKTHAGPVDEAPKKFEIEITLKGSKFPTRLWLDSSMSRDDVISVLLEFTRELLRANPK